MKRLWVGLVMAMSACGAVDEGALLDESEPGQVADGKADSASIAFTALPDPAIVPGNTTWHRVFTSQAGYRAFFGHSAPGIDFRRDWVVYFDAGLQAMGGGVTIDGISTSASGLTLNVAVTTTPACGGAPSTPFALARLHKQPATDYSRFYVTAQTASCPPPVLAPGTCDITHRCPGDGQCISRTWDSCTPNRPGCVGVCTCSPSSTACPMDEHFDNSIAVCGCAPGPG